MLIELRFVNEKPPRREAEIRKVVCVFGNDSVVSKVIHAPGTYR
jgi:hypothetical protein